VKPLPDDILSSYTIRTTISERRNCETLAEIGQAVLDLVTHYKSQDWYTGEPVTFQIVDEDS
jgi:hypothetical protein